MVALGMLKEAAFLASPGEPRKNTRGNKQTRQATGKGLQSYSHSCSICL